MGASPKYDARHGPIPAQEYLRVVIDTIPAFVFRGDSDGSFDFSNKRCLEFTGCTSEQLHGWGWRTVIHADDVDGYVAEWRSALAAGNPFESEVRVRRADGEYRWFRICKVPRRDRLGKILDWYGTGHDIEDLKRAEHALRTSEAYLAEGQRLAQTGSWAFNPAGYFDYWSSELFRIYGLEPRERAPSLEEYLASIHPEDREFMAHVIQRMVAEHLPCDVKKRIVRPDGNIRYIRCVGVPAFDNGAFREIVGTAMDVTAEELLTQQLRRREAYLAEAQKLSHTGSFGWNLQCGHIAWSDETFRIFEFDPNVSPTLEMILGRVHPEDRARVQEIIDRAFSGLTDFDVQYRLLMPSGAVKHLHVLAHAVKDGSGNVEFLGAATDITEQYGARAALEKAFNEIKTLKDQLYQENLALKEEIDQASMFEEIIGSSAALRRVLVHVAKVAPTNSTVLVTGETGTGKELFARAIHKRSLRDTRPFVSVNCAAIAPSLIASELFGYEKGAFTGATQRRLGRFELADGGTLFLDEVGELPPETQVALLRVLQERVFERVGGSQPIPVDVRVLAATNSDLQVAVEDGTFRRDLFYRLNVFPIHVPALRDRVEDIPLLVEYFIERYASKTGKKIRNVKKKTLELFQAYDWPGNIRELQNVVERAVILCDGDTLVVDETWLQLESPKRVTAGPLRRMAPGQEREVIESALKECEGRVSGPTGAAARLRIPRSTLESKIKSLRIKKHRFKSD
jgi:formate hydrogenlyase transcriptional activator